MKVYLDSAATTPVDEKVVKAMLPYLGEKFGNASSLHSFGREAREAVELARKRVADFLNCSTSEVFFTSGATESDNLAIFGTTRAALNLGYKVYVITTQIEHPAVLEPCKLLKKQGIDVSFLPVNKDGVVETGPPTGGIDLKNIDFNSKEKILILISIMYANNEIGAIQNIEQIGKALKPLKNKNGNIKILFHTDAVQAANYLDMDVERLGVDLLSLSGHKIYGPKGVGVLYAKKGTMLFPLLFGGHQEMGFRPGTENVACIAGFGEAIKPLMDYKIRIKEISRVGKLRDMLTEGILKSIPKSYLNGSKTNRLPNNANISFDGVEGESVLFALDQKGIAVSTGSACASGSLEPSHVLTSIGCSHERAHSSIRFTLGKHTTKQEINYVLKVLPGIIEKLRKISGK